MDNRIALYRGDCLTQLKVLADNSVDSMVTDPPSGIDFMSASWDTDKGGRESWVNWMADVMRECHRVLKPGAHAFVWSLPRRSHWTATAIENAGFEIRDVMMHIFGTGFPKSLNVSIAIDKAAGVERERIADNPNARDSHGKSPVSLQSSPNSKENGITSPTTDEAKQWSGWGTALKPAAENWILCRKELGEKTVAANVLKWGTGAINIDGCRVEARDQEDLAKNWDRSTRSDIRGGNFKTSKSAGIENNWKAPSGRFPANVVLSHNDDCGHPEIEYCTDECPVAEMNKQSGKSSGSGKRTTKKQNSMGFHGGDSTYDDFSYADSGGASRFFYTSKASKSDRGENNTHPTVKSTKLMTRLCRMITPPGGLVLDPFMGSGSTGVAALQEGFRFVGIESEESYFNIALGRLRI